MNARAGRARREVPSRDRRESPRLGGGLPGVAVAGITACISGVSVFVNGYGVHAIPQPSVYTTAKNVVATLFLAGFALIGWRLRGGGVAAMARRFVTTTRAGSVSPTGQSGPAPNAARRAPARPLTPAQWLALGYVGIVGGGIAFVLFFDGLAKTTATPAAFWRDTLVIWVAVLAIPVLGERFRWWNAAAVALLIGGQVLFAGGVGHLAADRGELLVLASSVLWALEVVVVKVLLRDLAPAVVALTRMGIGAAALVVYLALTGALGALVTFSPGQIGWALVTGLLLAGYVGTWISALGRARALDVTSVLVGSALVTWLLQAAVGTATMVPRTVGLLAVAAGAGLVAWASRRHPAGLTGTAEGDTARP